MVADRGKGTVMAKTQIMPLITRAHLAWKRHQEGLLAGRPITLKQLHLLQALAKREFLYPADIARLLMCDPPTARVVVRNLEKRRWVKGKADPDDARRTRVRLTAAGRKKLTALSAALKKSRPRRFNPTSCLSPTEITRLERMLRKVCEHLEGLGK